MSKCLCRCIEIKLFGDDCKDAENQGYRFYYGGTSDVGRCDTVEGLQQWVAQDVAEWKEEEK